MYGILGAPGLGLPLKEAHGETTHQFERLWPTLPQPWFFSEVGDTAIDRQGLVYVCNMGLARVDVYTQAGRYVRSIGSPKDSGLNGELAYPRRVTVDRMGQIFVLTGNPPISPTTVEVFNADGTWQLQLTPTRPSCHYSGYDSVYSFAVDSEGFLYSTCLHGDTMRPCVIKSDQTFNEVEALHATSAETVPSAGYFTSMGEIVIDAEDNLYVFDRAYSYDWSCIHKRTPDGAWSILYFSGDIGPQSGDGMKSSMKLGADGLLYVLLGEYEWSSSGILTTYKITQIDPTSGVILKEWATPQQSASGYPFMHVASVLGLSNGNVLAALSHSGGMVSYDANNNLLGWWRSWSHAPGMFNRPYQVEVDPDGDLYVLERGVTTVSQGSGSWLNKLGGNHRIQRFSADGVYKTSYDFWSIPDPVDGNTWPQNMAIDNDGNIYVCLNDEYNGPWTPSCVQKIMADGTLSSLRFGAVGSERKLSRPMAAAVDNASGKVFVLNRIDSGYSFDDPLQTTEIVVYNSSGGYETHWEVPYATDVDMDPTPGSSYVFVHSCWDPADQKILKYSFTGNLVAEYASPSSNTNWWYGGGVALDLVYRNGKTIAFVADHERSVVHEWDVEAEAVLNVFGERGNGVGAFETPRGVAVDVSGAVYVADTFNDRVQKFRPVTLSSYSKAIIVAGCGAVRPSGANNGLWTGTTACANYAYGALMRQGFTRDTVFYLNEEKNSLDLDGNGQVDDVDSVTTKRWLKYALTEWAQAPVNGKPVEDVVVYLVDHGLNSGSRTAFEIDRVTAENSLVHQTGGTALTAAEASNLGVMFDDELAAWLNALQPSGGGGIGGTLTVVIDTCHSGGFQNALQASDRNRIVISSALKEQEARFDAQGNLSYSDFFWTHVFEGLPVGECHQLAQASLEAHFNDRQTSRASDPLGLAMQTFIGSGVRNWFSGPAIGWVSPPQTIALGSTATIAATIIPDAATDPDGDGFVNGDAVGEVWATLRPPNFRMPQSGSPVVSLPKLPLVRTNAQSNRWEATHDGFNLDGVWHVTVYAGPGGRTSNPRLTYVTVNNPIRRRAIIVAGDGAGQTNWEAAAYRAGRAYWALRNQMYGEDDVYYLSRTTTPGVDALTTKSNVAWALTDWAASMTRDLTVFLVGPGSATNGVQLNESEWLSATELDAWLDALQAAASPAAPGVIAVVVDADYSGRFAQTLSVPAASQDIHKVPTRLVIASTGPDNVAAALAGGKLSFSQFFWSDVLNGYMTYDAYNQGCTAVQTIRGYTTTTMQTLGPKVTRNNLFLRGHGTPNAALANSATSVEVLCAYTVGNNILLAGSDPYIDFVTAPQSLVGDTAASIEVDGVLGNHIEQVMAVVIPPNADKSGGEDGTALVTLSPTGYNSYEAPLDVFREAGEYQFLVFATDYYGNVSQPKLTSVTQQVDQGGGAVLLASPHQCTVSSAGGAVAIHTYNLGDGVMDWTASSAEGWLSVSPAVGQDVGIATATVAANWDVADRSGTIVVSAPGAHGSPFACTVTQQGLADSDGDGFSDPEEGFDDEDGDGFPNYLDWESDGDGIPDEIEGAGDPDSDGISNYLDWESDGDGIPDVVEGYEDADDDGIPNFLDLESDGDGIPDVVEGSGDADGDGASNFLDLDADGDDIPDEIEGWADMDDDGSPNFLDLDSDDDGIPDAVEGYDDADEDGSPNFLDLDSDSDDVSDHDEWLCGSDPYDANDWCGQMPMPVHWAALVMLVVFCARLRRAMRA